MLKRTLFAGAAAALLAMGVSAPASAQGFCNSGPLGGGLCGAGIGGGLGGALGGRSGAQTGAIIGGVLGAATTPPPGYRAPPPPPRYYQPPPPPPQYGGYCNYNACAYRYRSFDPGSCTFQPYNGPRRLCRL